MLNPDTDFPSYRAGSSAAAFWPRILSDYELRTCDDLEKLLAGCEIIAALDAVELLAA